MRHLQGHLRRIVLVLVGLLLVTGLLWRVAPQARSASYSYYREITKGRTLASLSQYNLRSSSHFDLYFMESDHNVSELVLETAESVYEPVVQKVGHRPANRVPLILYPSREEMRREFGWGKSESAMGVYWAGTIRILSPNVWAEAYSAREKARVFRKINPLAHELTHHILDYWTSGNYPRWFTEGLAQRIEYQVTGYLWIEPSSSLRQPLYTLVDLQRRFDQLSNQPLAYRQSYLLVDYLARTFGESVLDDAVRLLGEGERSTSAIRKTTGRSLEQIYGDYMQWIQEHAKELDHTDE